MSHQDYILKLLGLEDKSIIFSKKRGGRFESGCYSCQYLRRLSVQDYSPAKRLRRTMSQGLSNAQTAYGGGGTIKVVGTSHTGPITICLFKVYQYHLFSIFPIFFNSIESVPSGLLINSIKSWFSKYSAGNVISIPVSVLIL